MRLSTTLLLAAAAQTLAAPQGLPALETPVTPLTPAAPTVQLGYGTFKGKTEQGVSSFLGIPFARPPVGDLRFRRAIVPPNAFTGIQDASKYGPSCSQHESTAGTQNMTQATLDMINSVPLFAARASDSEDCLTINVQRPAGIAAGTILPVVVWIYGGGFSFGGSDSFDGAPIVKRSLTLGKPILFVSMNYRLNAFGFLAGAQVEEAGVGNLGLDDQRAALRWINSNIHLFGGDKSKVSLFGESAGAISASLQLVSNGGNSEGLFRGLFSLSGAPIAVGSIRNGQKEFDLVAGLVGCTGADATLDCLRKVPYLQLKAAINQSPGIFARQSLRISWLPRVDGVFLTQRPFESVINGSYAKVAMVTGNCDDEGTIFSLTNSPELVTDEQAVNYIAQNYLPAGTKEEVANIALLYPSDPQQGSPFDTGFLNQLGPQFKRIASFTGDLAFQASRRHFLAFASKTQNTWAYVYKRNKATPFLGSFHSSELTTQFTTGPNGGVTDTIFIDYLVNFVSTLNPNDANNPTLLAWPKWDNTNGSPAMMTFLDRPLGGINGLAITSDTYRKAAIDFIIKLSLKYPI